MMSPGCCVSEGKSALLLQISGCPDNIYPSIGLVYIKKINITIVNVVLQTCSVLPPVSDSCRVKG